MCPGGATATLRVTDTSYGSRIAYVEFRFMSDSDCGNCGIVYYNTPVLIGFPDDSDTDDADDDWGDGGGDGGEGGDTGGASPPNDSNECENFSGYPVHMRTGEMHHRERDINIKGGGLGLSFIRTYRSQGDWQTPLDQG